MDCMLIKLKETNNINLNIKNVLDIFKISIGNNSNYKKKKFSNQHLEIIYNKNYNKRNIGKMIYESKINDKEIKILNEIFISNNMRRAKIIKNNREHTLKDNIKNESQNYKIKVKFLDNAIKLNSMFQKCKSLSKVKNFQNLNTKYIKTIDHLFSECSSLIYIDDISNWNTNYLKNMLNVLL